MDVSVEENKDKLPKPLNFKFTREWDIEIPSYDTVTTLNETFVVRPPQHLNYLIISSFDSSSPTVPLGGSLQNDLASAMNLAKRYTKPLPHFPIRFPGFLMDENFTEIRKIELEHYFQNLPRELFATTELRAFLEFYSQDFDLHQEEYTEEEKTEVWMTKNTKPIYESRLPWLKQQLQDSKFIILVFYRGSWCPYSKPHLKTAEATFNAVRTKGGKIFGVSAQSEEVANNFAAELGNGFELISDPAMSLALHFHTWMNKTSKVSHPTQILTQPAIIAIRGDISEEPESQKNVQWSTNFQTRKGIIAQENPDLEVLQYWATSESSGQPHLTEVWQLGIEPALSGAKGDISSASTTSFFDADIWKVKENAAEGSLSEIKFGDEDAVRSYLKNHQVQ